MIVARRWCAVGMWLLAAACEGLHSHEEPHDHERGSADEHEQGHAEHHAHDHAEDHPEGHDHHAEDHGHDAAVMRITRWQNGLELFAEHGVPVAGEPFEMLAHLTVLDGFRAVAQGPAKLELSGPARVEASVEQPDRPGIFRFTLTPATPGEYAARLVVGSGEGEAVIDGFAIVVHPNAASAAAAVPEHDDEGRIGFLKEQQWKVRFATAFVEEGSVIPSVAVPGTVDTPPGGMAEVSAPIAGRLVAPNGGLPHPGRAVRAGEVLALLAPAPSSAEDAARARLTVVEAETRERAAKTNLERAERLLADQAISQRELEDARRELAVASESVQAAGQVASLFEGARAGRGGGSWKVTAPIAGVVVRADAKPGASVSAEDVLFTIVNQEELWLRARVPEQDAARLKPELDASYRVSGLDESVPLRVGGASPSGRVVTVSPVVDPKTRSVEVIYALVDPDPHLRVGGLVTLELPVGAPWLGPVVPRDAVVEKGGRALVYVQVDGEHFEERAVRVGPASAGSIGVLDGIAIGERVVTLGANLVRLAAGASGDEPPHGHIH